MAKNVIYSYDEYIKLMYQKGFYIYDHNIDIMSHEIYSIENRIFILPVALNGEDVTYVFTGRNQKISMLSEPTEFRLYLEDDRGCEFEDSDNIMMSIIIQKGCKNLYTRNYATWKYGVSFETGVHLEQDKYLMFQTQKDIGKFDIEINNVDLFKRKNRPERKNERMMWIE